MTDMFKEQKTSLERGYSRSRGELIDRSLKLRPGGRSGQEGVGLQPLLNGLGDDFLLGERSLSSDFPFG